MKGKKTESDYTIWKSYLKPKENKLWKKFLKNNKGFNRAGLLRVGVNFFINNYDRILDLFDLESAIVDESIIEKYGREVIISSKEKFSHLRNKMAIVRGYAELLSKFRDDKHRQEDYFKKLDDSINALEKSLYKSFGEMDARDVIREFDVLYVEDKEELEDIVSVHVKERGYTIKCVETAEKALELMKYVKSKLILIDIVLAGGMQGDELCQKLNEDERYEKIPKVYLTGRILKFEVEKIMEESGVNDIILKPFKEEDLERIFDYLDKNRSK